MNKESDLVIVINAADLTYTGNAISSVSLVAVTVEAFSSVDTESISVAVVITISTLINI